VKPFVLLIQLVAGQGYALEADTWAGCQRMLAAEQQKQRAAGMIVASSGCYPRALIEHAAAKKAR
jgi:hypothetical protein